LNSEPPISINAVWHPAPPALSVSAGDLDLWRARIDDIDEGAEAALSDYERQRAERLRHRPARLEFARTRGWLRQALARYLQAPPDQLQFVYGPQGKPRLANCAEGEGVCFNVSHSHGVALLAVAWNRSVGVDVEQVRTDKDLLGLANRYFSANEIVALRQLASIQVSRGFFLAWTRKEAFIKALGSGMSFPLDAFDVALAPGAPAALLEVRSEQTTAEEWAMIDIDLGIEFAGAAVVRGSLPQARLWQLS
jgi:4'-phosphopantetheinyl transferase